MIANTRDRRHLAGLAEPLAEHHQKREIEEAQARLAAIVTASADAIVSKTLEGIITSWNAAAERMFGYTATEIVGRSVRTIIPQHLQHEEDMILSKIAAGERLDHYETVRMRKDGRLIDVSVTVSPVHDSSGRIIGAAKIARDISERKQSDERLATIRAALSAEPETGDPFELTETTTYTEAGAALAGLHPTVESLGLVDGPDRAFDQSTRLAAGVLQAPIAMLATRDGDHLHITSTYGLPPRLRERHAIAFDNSYCRFVIGSEVPVSIRDARHNPLVSEMQIWHQGLVSYLGVPIRDRDGVVVAALSVSDSKPRAWVLRDLLTLKGLAQQLMRELESRTVLKTLAENEERLRAASSAAGFGVYDTRVADGRTTWSAELARILGLGDAQIDVSAPGSTLAVMHPDDRGWMSESLAHVARTPGPYEFEWRTIRPNGMVRWLLDRGQSIGPTNPQTGLTSRITGIVVDITERKRHEEKILMLMREVNHRAKNMLGLVQAMARQTAAASPSEFVARFSERIQALSANQDLLVKNEWQGVDIQDLANAQLAHFEDLIGNRITLEGPPLRLNAAAAQGIGLALHELSTNAGKYGSLSNERGTVTLQWKVEAGQFEIAWQEAEGPPVVPPKRRGFGDTIITYAAETSVEGRSKLEFLPAGVRWRLTCPVGQALERL